MNRPFLCSHALLPAAPRVAPHAPQHAVVAQVRVCPPRLHGGWDDEAIPEGRKVITHSNVLPC